MKRTLLLSSDWSSTDQSTSFSIALVDVASGKSCLKLWDGTVLLMMRMIRVRPTRIRLSKQENYHVCKVMAVLVCTRQQRMKICVVTLFFRLWFIFSFMLLFQNEQGS